MLIILGALVLAFFLSVFFGTRPLEILMMIVLYLVILSL